MEIAARFAGRTIIPQTDFAHGCDLVGALADALLRGTGSVRRLDPDLPPSRAAATVYLYGSECLGTRRPPVRFGGFQTHPAELLDPGVRVAGYAERERGWPVEDRAHEQPYWLAQLYLQGTSLAAVRESVVRVRRESRLMPEDG
ncbi:hypothetical protein [Actinokineospora sp. NPDC004072]